MKKKVKYIQWVAQGSKEQHADLLDHVGLRDKWGRTDEQDRDEKK